MDYLTDIEKDALVQFNQHAVMFDAVKKVLLAGLYENGRIEAGKDPAATRNAAFGLVAQGREFSNEELGADLRALWQGVNALEMGFKKINEFIPKEKADKQKENKAR